LGQFFSIPYFAMLIREVSHLSAHANGLRHSSPRKNVAEPWRSDRIYNVEKQNDEGAENCNKIRTSSAFAGTKQCL